MVYKINKFLYYFIKDDLMICQNEFGVVKIHHQSLIDFLKSIHIEVRNKETISYDEVNNFFPDDTEGVIDFLLSRQLISEYHELNFNIQRVLMISNSEEVEKMVIDNIHEDIVVSSLGLEETEQLNSF